MTTMSTTKRCDHCGKRITHDTLSNTCSYSCRMAHKVAMVKRRQGLDERYCEYRECKKRLPDKEKGRRGPVPRYCKGTLCRRRERWERDKESGKVPEKKGRPKSRPDRRKYQEGQSFDGTELTLLRYSEPDGRSATYGWFRCSCGNEKELQIRYVAKATTTTCSDRARHPDPRSAGEMMQNGTWHHYLAKRFGSASTHPCVVCGVKGKGNDWAYRHSSFEARSQLVGRDKGQVYSVDPADYWVMCRKHHKPWDNKHAEVVPKGRVSGEYVALAMAFDSDYDEIA